MNAAILQAIEATARGSQDAIGPATTNLPSVVLLTERSRVEEDRRLRSGLVSQGSA
jgi:hypothetical protein